MRTNQLLGSACVMCLAAAAAPGQTAPQTAAGSPGRAAAVENIVVTARKVRENLQRVPISVTALGGASLKSASVRTVNDLQNLVPNLYLQKSANDPQALYVSIRGQKQNDTPLTLDPSVGLYVDGLYLPRTYGLANALVDINRVEVLRGPQGTLYGRNTTGGAVSIFSNDPTDRPGALLDVTGGNYGSESVLGVINTPVADGVDLRIVGQHDSHDGYGRNGLDQPLDSDDGTYLRAKLKAKLGASVTATLWGDYSQDQSDGLIAKLSGLAPGTPPGGVSTIEAAAENGNLTPAGIAAAASQLQSYTGGGYRQTFGTFPGASSFQGERGGLNLDADLGGGITLRSITGYQHFDRSFEGDLDGTPFNLLDGKLGTYDRYASEELQLLGGGSNFNWVAGLYAGDERGKEYSSNYILTDINPNNPNDFDAYVHNRSEAAFGQFNWAFLPSWRLTGGVRYSSDLREIAADNTDGPQAICVVPAPGVSLTPPGAAQCPRIFQHTYSSPSWLVSIDHQFTPDILGYFKISQGYRSGGFNYRGSNSVQTFAPFAPETVTEFETGVKSELFDHRVRVNVAAYRDDYTNIQQSVTVPTASGAPATVITNAASAVIDGFEAETVWRATDNFTLNASTSLTDANYIKFVDLTGNRSGEHFDVPKWTVLTGFRYAEPTPWGEAALQANYHWQTEVQLVPSAPTLSQVTQNAYGVLDARATLDIDRWGVQVALYGKNLTDRNYLASAISLESALGFNYVIPGDPRTYGIELIKRFGGI